MRHHFSPLIVSVTLLSVLSGCDAYQREVNLSVVENPTPEDDDTKSVSLDVFVSSNDQVSFDDREVDTEELRTEVRRLSDSNIDCVVALRVHPNARTGTIMETRDLIFDNGCSLMIERLSWDQQTSD